MFILKTHHSIENILEIIYTRTHSYGRWFAPSVSMGECGAFQRSYMFLCFSVRVVSVTWRYVACDVAFVCTALSGLGFKICLLIEACVRVHKVCERKSRPVASQSTHTHKHKFIIHRDTYSQTHKHTYPQTQTHAQQTTTTNAPHVRQPMPVRIRRETNLGSVGGGGSGIESREKYRERERYNIYPNRTFI